MKMKEFTDTELEQEQWRDIDGYDGMYQVSDLGRVRSKKYGDWMVMKQGRNRKGYLFVNLYRYGKRKTVSVHRIVAQAFIHNYDESKIYTNHIDECKQNNRLWNLEYCTPQYNTNYNDVQFRKKNSKRRKIEKLYDPNLSIKKNLEIFKANGVDCSKEPVLRLRKDLGLTKQHELKRHKLKELYRPDLSINENLEVFRANGIECCEKTVQRLRKDLGLTIKYTKRS